MCATLLACARAHCVVIRNLWTYSYANYSWLQIVIVSLCLWFSVSLCISVSLYLCVSIVSVLTTGTQLKVVLSCKVFPWILFDEMSRSTPSTVMYTLFHMRQSRDFEVGKNQSDTRHANRVWKRQNLPRTSVGFSSNAYQNLPPQLRLSTRQRAKSPSACAKWARTALHYPISHAGVTKPSCLERPR